MAERTEPAGRYGTRSKTAVRVSAAEKQRRALELRLSGLNYRQIAAELAYKSVASAHEAVRSALRDIPKDAADELRTVELERYDEMQARMTAALRTGDLRVIPDMIRLSDQRAKLTGLYTADTTAEHVEVTVALQGFLSAAQAQADAMDEADSADMDRDGHGHAHVDDAVDGAA
jgi:hypothetical protein